MILSKKSLSRRCPGRRIWYDNRMDIIGKTAVITGASGRLGGAIALGLAARGMDCVCHCHADTSAAEAVVERIQATGRRAAAVRADLACAGDIERLFETAAAFGTVRVLINSAALFQRQPLAEMTAETISRTLAVNLTAPMLTSRHFVALLKADGLDCRTAAAPFAKIINLADVAATKPWAEYAAYCASKAGLAGLTQALAKELAPGITVNAVAPGIVTWPEPMTPTEEQKQLARIPAGRFGQPEDIAKSVAFLLDNDYITGHTLPIDGGRSL